MDFDIRSGSEIEFDLPILPDRNRLSRRGEDRLSWLRHTASHRLLSGKRWVHDFRLFESSGGRSQNQRVRDRFGGNGEYGGIRGIPGGLGHGNVSCPCGGCGSRAPSSTPTSNG